MDIVFACLSDSLGWDPVSEVFGRLEGRERWPIPWLEDDPSMWLPQFHVHRFERDMNLAETYGCQGLIGIHCGTGSWIPRRSTRRGSAGTRTEACGPLSGLRSHPGGSGSRSETRRGARQRRSRSKAFVHLVGRDSGRARGYPRVLRGLQRGVHLLERLRAGSATLRSQKDVAESLRSIAEKAAAFPERERLEYLAHHAEFLVPYSEAWILAHRIHRSFRKPARSRRAATLSRQRRRSDLTPSRSGSGLLRRSGQPY